MVPLILHALHRSTLYVDDWEAECNMAEELLERKGQCLLCTSTCIDIPAYNIHLCCRVCKINSLHCPFGRCTLNFQLGCMSIQTWESYPLCFCFVCSERKGKTATWISQLHCGGEVLRQYCPCLFQIRAVQCNLWFNCLQGGLSLNREECPFKL